MKIALWGASLFFLVAACSSSSSTGSSGTTGTTGPSVSTPTCLDASGKPTTTCALTPTGNTCAMGDANSCTPLTKLEVTADDGTTGVCLHLVYDNQCTGEIYADTCIEHKDSSGVAADWQCWTSSVLAGETIDVSECHATGNYFYVSTASSGQLDIDEQKCPAPR